VLSLRLKAQNLIIFNRTSCIFWNQSILLVNA